MCSTIHIAFIFVCVILTTSIYSNENSLVYPSKIKDFNKNLHSRVKTTLDAIELNDIKMNRVKALFDQNKYEDAAEELVKVIVQSREKNDTKFDKGIKEKIQLADEIINDTFTFQTIKSKHPRTKIGGIDWLNKGPKHDGEWSCFLNRHQFLKHVARVGITTGDQKYFKYINNFISDWIQSNAKPEKRTLLPTWRTLEVGLRLSVWSELFEMILGQEGVSEATIFLMIASILEQVEFLEKNHSSGSNWVLMEMSGLVNTGLKFKEFKNSSKWVNHANSVISKQMKHQVHSDGSQKELTSHYHLVSTLNFHGFLQEEEYKLAKKSDFYQSLEKMWEYAIYSLKPSLHNPLNNDSDSKSLFNIATKKTPLFNRKDWEYILTNGESGQKPNKTSVFFADAGQAIFRNGYGKMDEWSFFDIGPAGTSHRHNDKLHISIHSHGRDLIVDSGRFSYNHKLRKYFTGSSAHNNIIIDGNEQIMGRSLNPKPINKGVYLSDDLDFAIGSNSDGYHNIEEKVIHTRALAYYKNHFWLVVDHIKTQGERNLETLWHFHPSCNTVLENHVSLTKDQGVGNVSITPASNLNWNSTIIKGQDSPQPQGWYSPEYNVKQANNTSSYTTKIEKSNSFGWIFKTGIGKLENTEFNLIHSNGDYYHIEILKNKKLQAEVIIKFNPEVDLTLKNGSKMNSDLYVSIPNQKPIVLTWSDMK